MPERYDVPMLEHRWFLPHRARVAFVEPPHRAAQLASPLKRALACPSRLVGLANLGRRDAKKVSRALHYLRNARPLPRSIIEAALALRGRHSRKSSNLAVPHVRQLPSEDAAVSTDTTAHTVH